MDLNNYGYNNAPNLLYSKNIFVLSQLKILDGDLSLSVPAETFYIRANESKTQEFRNSDVDRKEMLGLAPGWGVQV